MTERCESIRRELLELTWTAEQYQQAQRIVEHVEACAACRAAAADYQAIQTSLQATETSEPKGGWTAFEERLAAAASGRTQRPVRWGWSIAAGLLIGLAGLNAALLVRNSRPPAEAMPGHGDAVVQVPPDMTDSTVAKAFVTVSSAFEGRANWVMLSDQSSELGLTDDSSAGKELLILRLVVTRGGNAISQVHLAIVPGATARMTVPAKDGAQLEYVITTDAQDPQHIGVWMTLGDGKLAAMEGGLGSMATSLSIPYGQTSRTGQITTRDGTYDMSMSLQHQAAGQTGA